jgi:hypothetical protein
VRITRNLKEYERLGKPPPTPKAEISVPAMPRASSLSDASGIAGLKAFTVKLLQDTQAVVAAIVLSYTASARLRAG